MKKSKPLGVTGWIVLGIIIILLLANTTFKSILYPCFSGVLNIVDDVIVESGNRSFTDNISAYYVQEYSSTITPYSINVLPNEVVQQYYTYGVSELCQCSPTYVPFSTECKQFNVGNIFSLWICDKYWDKLY